MHDPLVVIASVRRPIPTLRRKTHQFNNGRRIACRHTWAKWYRPWEGWMTFWKIGPWEAYFPSMVTIWHREPGGHDSGAVCSSSSRKWHLHHWRIQFHPWQAFRRWALTRCEWCGGRSRRGDAVNVSRGWDRARGPWWRGERGLFHGDCSAIDRAHRMCVCIDGLTDPRPGVHECLICGKLRRWDQDTDRSPSTPASRILASIPAGRRDPEKYAEVKAMWSAYRHATEEDA